MTIYASYNRMLASDLKLSEQYRIDYDRTEQAITENRKYHSNREALSIIITEIPLSTWDIQRWILTDIAAENARYGLIEYVGTLGLTWHTVNALRGVIEYGTRIKNREDVREYARKFEPELNI